jgi:hypothetical protein
MSESDIHDEVPQALYLQPLTERLAPAVAERDAEPDLFLPRAGDAVVIARGHVIWLTASHDARPVTESTAYLWGAPLNADGSGVRWDPASIGQLDATCLMHRLDDAEAIRAAQALLIELANTTEVTAR